MQDSSISISSVALIDLLAIEYAKTQTEHSTTPEEFATLYYTARARISDQLKKHSSEVHPSA